MPEISSLLAPLLAIAALFGSLASTSGTTHTNVANQLRLLIAEFHKFNLVREEDRKLASHHLEVLQKQIHYFAIRVQNCQLVHAISYVALNVSFFLIPFALREPDLPIKIIFYVFEGVLMFITSIRLKELGMGATAIQIAATEVLDIRLHVPIRAELPDLKS